MKVKIIKVNNGFDKYGKPWWKDNSHRFNKETDLMKTFKEMGWIPPSELRNVAIINAEKAEIVQISKQSLLLAGLSYR